MRSWFVNRIAREINEAINRDVDSFLEETICIVGKVYNETFQELFGDYRLSETIIDLNDGVEPEWLADLHDAWDACRERGDL